MCGICGIIPDNRERIVSGGQLLAMRDALMHRGPDDAGQYLAPGVALGSRRLAILDLSPRGHMPMSTPGGRYWIAYNGEVYNYRELRSSLLGDANPFRSNTDTEVLVRLYAANGPAMLERLNGMFALAIWDNEERSLFLARDRMGIKPLYYAHHEETLYFASEEKALFAAGVPAQFDHSVWPELLCFRYLAGERTPFKGVRRLLPGHYTIWRDGKAETHRWWNLSQKARARREELPANPADWYQETFDDAVKLRRISDVPVGVLLSGGLDSSSVAASTSSQVGSGIASFTMRFNEAGYDEGPLARQVVKRWKLEGHELTVPPHTIFEKLRRAAWFNDEPQVHASDLYLLAISEYAKPRVTVLLSGEGADETLGGYLRYQPLRYSLALPIAQFLIPRATRALNLNGRWRKLSRFLELGSVDRFVLFNSCDVLPEEIESLGVSSAGGFSYREQVLTEAQSLYPGDLARQAMYSDQHTFLCSVLDRNDRMTMGASIECRVPFLDYRLVEMLAALPSSVLFKGRRTKALLRRAVGFRLPKDILQHHKWGFGVPWKQYLRQEQELRSVLEELPNASLILESPLDRPVLKKNVREFLDGDDAPFPIVMQIMMTALSWEAVTAGMPQLH
jgi:asparagine synthase (glutamine-hydrolysing)